MTTVYFAYGTNANYGSTNVISNVGSGTSALPVNSGVTGLSPGTAYHFQALASNSVGTASGGDMTFTTAAASPLVATKPATAITSSSATFKASVTPRGAMTTVYFVYGTNANYGSTNVISNVSSGTSALPVNSGVTGLLPGTAYHFQALASNSVGTASGGDLTFTTTAASPLAVTQPATAVTFSSATFNASVTPRGAMTTVYFVYGTNANYGSTNVISNVSSGTSALPISSSVTGLSPGALYHFQALASNSVGTASGGDMTFTTTAASPLAVTQPATAVTFSSATFNASVTPQGAMTTVYFAYGTNANYGSTNALSNVASGTSALAVSSGVTGLLPGAIYHYQALASNSVGTASGGDLTFTTGAQAYSLGVNAVLLGPAGGTNSIVLAVTPQTGTWTNTPNAAWLHLSVANQSGAGSTNVIFSFDANADATRSGTLTIAGLTLTVTQAGSTYVAAQPVTTLFASNSFHPCGVAVDAMGNVFIADASNNVIDKWTKASNTMTTLISSNLDAPGGVAVDGVGNVYIADSNDNAIKELVSASSNLVTLVSVGLNNPQDVAVDSLGNVYFSDSGNNAIKEWTASNSNVTTLMFSGLLTPGGVAVDAAENVYAADTSSNAVKELTAANGAVSALGFAGLARPNGIAVDGAGNVYVADTNDISIKELLAWNGDLTSLVSSNLSIPSGVAVDGAGNIYIGDLGAGLLEIPYAFVDPTAMSESSAAGTDSLPTVLPATANLLASFYPTSDQSWLSIGGITNGVVSVLFSFNNTGAARTCHIKMLGQTIPVTQTAQPPLVSTQTATAVSFDSAILHALVNPEGAATTLYFVYGLSTDYGSTNLDEVDGGTNALPLNTEVTGLLPDTVYHFQAVASNSVGTALGGDSTFTTPANAPTVFTQPATAIGCGSAMFNASVTPQGATTTVYFAYGTNADYGSASVMSNMGSGNGALPVSSGVTGLLLGTTYHVQALASNNLGTILGGDVMFTTLATLPLAVTQPATAISSNSAALNALVSPQGAATAVCFAFGKSTNYGSTYVLGNVGCGSSGLSVTTAATGLLPGTTYHFQAVASNSMGAVSAADVAFTTAVSVAPPATIITSNSWGIPPFLSVAVDNGQVNLTVCGTVGAPFTIMSTTNDLSMAAWSAVTNVTVDTIVSVANTNSSVAAQNVLDAAFVPGTVTLSVGAANAAGFQYFLAVMPYDYIILADQVLPGKGYTPRLMVINMPGIVADDACYVSETSSFIHYSRTNCSLQLISSGSTIRQIATSLASSLNLDWTSASEFTYSNGLYQVLATVIETEPSSSDPVAGKKPPGPPIIINF
jgi:sugar lactone lactonase YvrE